MKDNDKDDKYNINYNVLLHFSGMKLIFDAPREKVYAYFEF